MAPPVRRSGSGGGGGGVAAEDLAAETAAREAEDSNLQFQINSTASALDLQQEITDRIAADNALQDGINSVIVQHNNHVLAESEARTLEIADEEAARIAADAALQAQIDAAGSGGAGAFAPAVVAHGSFEDLDDWDLTLNGASIAASGDHLTFTHATNEKRLIHQAVPTEADTVVQVQWRQGAAGAADPGLIAKYLDANNFLLGMSYDDGAGNRAINLFRCDAGAFTQIAAATNTAGAFVAGKDYWLRLSISGNRCRLAWFEDNPMITLEPTPLVSLDSTLGGAQATKFGRGIIGRAGIRVNNIPAGSWMDQFVLGGPGPASGGGSGGAAHTIQDEGVVRTPRTGLNFIGAGVSATDDEANDRTNVTITEPAPSMASFANGIGWNNIYSGAGGAAGTSLGWFPDDLFMTRIKNAVILGGALDLDWSGGWDGFIARDGMNRLLIADEGVIPAEFRPNRLRSFALPAINGPSPFTIAIFIDPDGSILLDEKRFNAGAVGAWAAVLPNSANWRFSLDGLSYVVSEV
jgi:hypothetical protein